MATNERGEILCDDCGGTGLDPDEPAIACPVCAGRKVKTCDSAGCMAPATIEGSDGLFVYCGPRHAFDDDAWPACIRCGAEPQEPVFGPFCSGTCEERTLGEIQRAQLARWRKKLAEENEAVH